ncbi:ribose-phosphate pyrophosphokinase [Pseudohongiella spirulinae]|uniref:ribose-phosphate diphosphokinase n=1 Tax=Pseudohongiella spirulinae TaxID=1249552 RepID=A0A0S2KAF0_9GAMM|nr:ribose-phosphate pyrophosphokinase [Pseudohongiella spirulinae]ALO45028.1 Ribose-phosphate diphosphokinase [Pseudohongiella spirulinae]
MTPILYEMPGQEPLARSLSKLLGWQQGQAIIRQFPDGETYIRILDDVRDKKAVILSQLHHPDETTLPMLLMADTLRDLGAEKVGLIAPYLAYMRQDKRFNEGEGVSSHYYSRLISAHLDWLLTVDPHLHRIHDLSEVYSIPSLSLTAVAPMAGWIRENVDRPLIIGPDSESEQWAARVAELAGAPCEVLTKQRLGDRDVKISLPHVDRYLDYTPVLVDDMISTGRTMIQAAGHLTSAGMRAPICVVVHGLFSPGARQELQDSQLTVVTCNSIPDASNKIDLAPLLGEGLACLSGI